MNIHETPEFLEWWNKPFRTQPSGPNVTADFSMVCWIVSFRGRITNKQDSYAKWRKNCEINNRHLLEDSKCQKAFDYLYDIYDTVGVDLPEPKRMLAPV